MSEVLLVAPELLELLEIPVLSWEAQVLKSEMLLMVMAYPDMAC
jgi:hypothetical protein